MKAEPEDELLRELGRRGRERQGEDAAARSRREERWDRLAAGDLSPEEEAELAAEAGGSTAEAERLAAFRPLGDAFHERLLGALDAQRERERAARGAGDPRAADGEATEPVTQRPLTPPGAPASPPARRRFRSAPLWAAASVVAAFGACLSWMLVPAPEALPAYAADLQGGGRVERGGGTPAGPPVYSPGSELRLVLQPAEPVAEPVRVRCRIARLGSAHLEEWPPCARAKGSREGSLRVAGRVGEDIPFEAGEWSLWVIVERDEWRGRLRRSPSPSAAELLALAPGHTLDRPGWQAHRLAKPLRFQSL